MRRITPVINPSKKQLLVLRIMILIGVIYMFFFLKEALGFSSEWPLLYWMLVTTLVFACGKIIHEWIHYFYISVPKTPAQEKVYKVDIFTTFCPGEPYRMITETLEAIQAITYPHNTFLCDEADDPYLKEFCKKRGIFHVTRTDKTNAKAGNINNALKQSSAELCVVLDPDHVPFPDFLDPIVSHFNNPEIGFVQVVQAYYNYNESLIAKGAAQQTFQFYGPIMMSMNKYGTVQAIGANCTFRRAALDSIGGHAAGLAEDMHTAMQLHAKGWKSVYVPEVLARGLVPSTLSAYYSQQLKWSRGVFELLISSYPKLFKKLTWQQKLHYITAPLHYLSGIVILINFLIPVLALFFNKSPINIDFIRFVALALPLTAMIILIRHYVQIWVMEEDERGFHVVGGLLQIGTWWIFLTGLVYTLLRKKVPYIPTPKDGNEQSKWSLSIPNFIIIILSVAAIIYGLHNDWNPFNLIMAGFAALNCLILTFTIAASKQSYLKKVRKGNYRLSKAVLRIAKFKRSFWKFRRVIYSGVRKYALIIAVFVIGVSLLNIYEVFNLKNNTDVISEQKNTLIPGIFFPQKNDGLSSFRLIKQSQEQSDINFGIISLYIPWGNETQCYIPDKLVDSIYNSNAIPMISWEPWQNLFKQNRGTDFKDVKVFEKITNGVYDNYLSAFSSQVKALKKPVFLRFAHEADNPQYPWSARGNNSSAEFKAAWKYVYNYFKRNAVDNVIWVWNPWKPEAVHNYFPGKDYIDWIGVTNLNYGSKNPDGKWYTMKELYQPFHNLPVFRSGIPVILTEMGSLLADGRQKEWFEQAFEDITAYFPEIKAFVLFNNVHDENVVDPLDTEPLNWEIHNLGSIAKALKNTGKRASWLNNPSDLSFSKGTPGLKNKKEASLTGLRGVNYFKGQNWSANYHALRKDEIEEDISAMKRIGLNAIRVFGPHVYDRNVFNVSQSYGMAVVYSFWTPNSISYSAGSPDLNNYAREIVSTVSKHKDEENIVLWNIANSSIQNLSNNYDKPDLLYAKQVYINWLKQLIQDIKKEDPKRAVSVDIPVGKGLIEDTEFLYNQIPEIDYFALVADDGFEMMAEIKNMKMPYYFSKISTSDFLKDTLKQTGVFISNWQDERTERFVTYNGLKDNTGKNKYEFYQLANAFQGIKIPEKLPSAKILLPAHTVVAGEVLAYHALLYDSGKWTLATGGDTLNFKWELVKNDKFGNPKSVTLLGKGKSVNFKIPVNPHRYKLYLYVSNNNQTSLIKSNLNTPLYKY